MSIRIKADVCRGCGEKMTAIDDLSGSPPLPNDGDVAICLYCNHIHVFEGGKMRDATDAERDEIALDTGIINTMQFNRLYQKVFPKRRGT